MAVRAPRVRRGTEATASAGIDRACGKVGSKMNYQDIITIEPGRRGGRPTIRGMRIAVADVLGWMAAGMSHEEILSDYPELTEEDIRACLAYAADRERRLVTATT
jgi:uncharacterized protein (DUF433 family)